MNNFKCRLLTPVGMSFEGDVISVYAPGELGRFGVLAGHENMVAKLTLGLIKIQTGKSELFFVVDSGVLEVDGMHEVTVIADHAYPVTNEEDGRNKCQELKLAKI